jgi:hypothetical protein
MGQGSRVGICALFQLGTLPSGPCACDWPLCHVVHCNTSSGSDSDSSPATAGAWNYSGRSLSGGSATSSGGGGSGGGGAESALPSSSRLAGIPVLTTGECYVLAVSERGGEMAER